jgi:hypothetical protein
MKCEGYICSLRSVISGMRSSRYVCSMLILILFLFYAVSPVLADEGSGDTLVSSGTLVAAAFETMGYLAQQQILSDMSEQITELAGLIYLGVLVSAVVTAGLLGNYVAGLWIIVGPSLFIFVSGVSMNSMENRIDARAPEWRFGAFEDDQGLKDKFTRVQVSTANVSFVFHKYNELISELYHLLISEITSEDVTNQMLFMARQRMIEELYGLDIDNPETKTLVGYMLVYCPDELAYAQKMAAIKRDPEREEDAGYEHARDRYCDEFPKKNKRLHNKQLGKYLRDNLNVEYADGDIVSCLDLWNWSIMGLRKDVASGLESTINFVFGPEIAAAYGQNIIEEALRSVERKLKTPADGATTEEDPCSFDGPMMQGVEGSESFKALVNIFSGLVMRKSQTALTDQTALQQIYSGNFSGFKSSDESMGKRYTSDKDSKRRRARAVEASVTNQFEAFHVVMLVPYLQAILLYVLSIMYPFFALMIIVPGQASSFFTWMALWAWVKSWDVGWALVMVTDRLLFEVMPHQTFFDEESTEFTPVSLMEMHFDGDYAYSAAFYWVILSTMISAVPVVTAQLILGSKRAIAGALARGINDISNRMTTPASNYYRTQAMRTVKEEQARQDSGFMTDNAAQTESGLNKAGTQIASDTPTFTQSMGTPVDGDKASGKRSGSDEAKTRAELDNE